MKFIVFFCFILSAFPSYAEPQQTGNFSEEQRQQMWQLQMNSTIQMKLSSAQSYQNGTRGKEKDMEQAIRYYEEAAGLGSPQAELMLAMIYNQDKEKADRAFYWSQRAADRGIWNAQFNLGALYLEGRGTEMDQILGYKWIKVAYSNAGDEAAEMLPVVEEMEAQLDAETIADADKFVEDWRKEFERKKNEPKETPELVIEQNGLSTNISIKGSLEPTGKSGCVDITDITNDQNPPDLFLSFLDCGHKGEWDKSVELYILATMYGQYDGKRIADPTAASGLNQLHMQVNSLISDDHREQFNQTMKNDYHRESDKRKKFCEKLDVVGYPTYHPDYMILVGLTAYDGVDGDGLKHFFDKDEEWRKLMIPNCPVEQ